MSNKKQRDIENHFPEMEEKQVAFQVMPTPPPPPPIVCPQTEFQSKTFTFQVLVLF